jgi:hypothetical protein
MYWINVRFEAFVANKCATVVSGDIVDFGPDDGDEEISETLFLVQHWHGWSLEMNLGSTELMLHPSAG